MGAVTHCHSAGPRAESLLGTVRAVVARPWRLGGTQRGRGCWDCGNPQCAGASLGTLRAQGCAKGHRAWGHRAQRDADGAGTQDSAPSFSLGAEPAAGRQGVTTPVTAAGGSAAGPVAGAGRAALSQAVSPDPLNHWKIRQGSGTGNSRAPGGHPAPLGPPGSTGKRGRMWDRQPGLSCSPAVARGQPGPHEEPERREMLSVHPSPRPGEVREAPWGIPATGRTHLHPGNGVGTASHGRG